MFGGKQVIPAVWLQKATSAAHDSSVSQSEPDSQAGYGYGFWRCAGMKNTFRCEGLYSQYAISFGDYDACLVVTGACAELQKTLDVIWAHIGKAFIEPDEQADGVRVVIAPAEPFPETPRSKTEKEIDGCVYRIGKRRFIDACGYPASSIPMPAMFFAKDKGGDITDLSFRFHETGCTMGWTEHGGFVNTQEIAMNGTYAHGKITIGELSFDTVACGRWTDENTLEVCIRALSAVASRRFVFTFRGNRITMYPDMLPSMDERSKVIGEKLKCVLKGRYFEWWIDTLVPRVKNILQPMHHGRKK